MMSTMPLADEGNFWLRDRPSPELGGIAEVADEFDVPRTTASMWYVRRATSGFPDAVAVLGMGPVFDMAAVRRWYAEKYPGKKEST